MAKKWHFHFISKRISIAFALCECAMCSIQFFPVELWYASLPQSSRLRTTKDEMTTSTSNQIAACQTNNFNDSTIIFCIFEFECILYNRLRCVIDWNVHIRCMFSLQQTSCADLILSQKEIFIHGMSPFAAHSIQCSIHNSSFVLYSAFGGRWFDFVFIFVCAKWRHTRRWTHLHFLHLMSYKTHRFRLTVSYRYRRKTYTDLRASFTIALQYFAIKLIELDGLCDSFSSISTIFNSIFVSDFRSLVTSLFHFLPDSLLCQFEFWIFRFHHVSSPMAHIRYQIVHADMLNV